MWRTLCETIWSVLTDNRPAVRDWVEILQGLVIIVATIFTARWTYRTFAHRERMQELKDLKRTVEEYHHALTLFCAQLRDDEISQAEIHEKLALGALHNRLAALARLNLYSRRQFRSEVQSIVGRWITNDRLAAMQNRRSTPSRSEAWEAFNAEYQEVAQLIEGEAQRLL